MIKIINVWFLSFYLMVLFGCNNYHIGSKVEIIIQDGYSTKINLKDHIFTVYNSDLKHEQIQIPFKLTLQEDSLINDLFYKKGLDNFFDSTYIEDDCDIMPKIFTKVQVTRNKKSSVIFIDRSCNNFKFKNYRDAKKVISFLNSIDKIVLSKKEIKNAPKSNSIYL